MAFIHLHNHTQYSVLDGECQTNKMVALVKNMNACCIMTDHGNSWDVDFLQLQQKKNKTNIYEDISSIMTISSRFQSR